MKLKKSKEEVLRDINSMAYGATYNSLSNFGYTAANNQQAMNSAIQQAITDAVTAGFRTLLDNQYTDEDFERDLTLTT